MNPQVLLTGILVPALVVGATLLIAWGLASGAARRDTAAPAPAAAIAISLAGWVGFGLLFGWQLQPAEASLWVFWVFPCAAAFGAFEARAGTVPAVRWLCRFALSGIAIALVLHKPLWPSGGQFDYQKAAVYVGTPLVLIGVWHIALPRLGAALGAGALWMVATGSAAMLLFAGSLKLAQIGGTLAGGLGALIVACWLRPSPSGMAGAITPVAVLLSTLVFLSFEFSYAAYSRWLFALVALAPLFGALPFARKPSMRLALIAIPIAIAVGLAFRTYDTSAL